MGGGGGGAVAPLQIRGATIKARGPSASVPFTTWSGTRWYQYAIYSVGLNLCVERKLSKRGGPRRAWPVAFLIHLLRCQSGTTVATKNVAEAVGLFFV